MGFERKASEWTLGQDAPEHMHHWERHLFVILTLEDVMWKGLHVAANVESKTQIKTPFPRVS